MAVIREGRESGGHISLEGKGKKEWENPWKKWRYPLVRKGKLCARNRRKKEK